MRRIVWALRPHLLGVACSGGREGDVRDVLHKPGDDALTLRVMFGSTLCTDRFATRCPTSFHNAANPSRALGAEKPCCTRLISCYPQKMVSLYGSFKLLQAHSHPVHKQDLKGAHALLTFSMSSFILATACACMVATSASWSAFIFLSASSC